MAVSSAGAVTPPAVGGATAIAVPGQPYHEERRIPVVEPGATLAPPVIRGLPLFSRLA
jgi:hypothetical protein